MLPEKLINCDHTATDKVLPNIRTTCVVCLTEYSAPVAVGRLMKLVQTSLNISRISGTATVPTKTNSCCSNFQFSMSIKSR